MLNKFHSTHNNLCLENEINLVKQKKQEILKKFNITLEVPSQDKRIDGLFNLLKDYLPKSDTKGFIYQKIINYTKKIIDIYKIKLSEIEKINSLSPKTPKSFKEIKLNNLNYKFLHKTEKIEEKIFFYKKLIFLHDNCFAHHDLSTVEEVDFLKTIDEKCFKNWLRVLDINYELRNTIIGNKNQWSVYEISSSYVDYVYFVENNLLKMFDEIKEIKKNGVKEYYEILNYFNVPKNKLLSFQLFLQKKIESKIHEAFELKSPLGNLIDYDYLQIKSVVDEITEQKKNIEDDLFQLINFYKEKLLKKQLLFSEKINKLISYLKTRYIEKINNLFFQLEQYNKSVADNVNVISENDKELLAHFAEEEFNKNLKNLKKKYSKQIIPLIENFSNYNKIVENKYALNPVKLEKKFIELKNLKKNNLEYIVNKFQIEENKINNIFDEKKILINDFSKLTIKKINEITQKLKKDAENICCDIFKQNQRFWTKVYAEFNSSARRMIVKLNHEYTPWTNIWNENQNSWMHDYLIVNLNQEYLNAIGLSLKEFSPESDLYIKSSKALMQYNEIMRKINSSRDLVEYEQLIKINTLPKINYEKLSNYANEILIEFKNIYNKYWENYNSCYKKLIS